MVTRLLGEEAFNTQIAMPYLANRPPKHWALCQLGDDLPTWLATHLPDYANPAAIDFAAQKAFWMEDLPATTNFEQKLYLQPYISLFALEEDLFTYRDALLAGKSHQVEKKSCYFVVFRDLKNCVCWEEIQPSAYALLSCFQQGATLQEASIHLDASNEVEIPFWFQKWTYLNWFCKK